MSVRRRAIKARVERDRKCKEDNDRMSASLARVQAVIDEALAAGEWKLTPEEFQRRIAAKDAS